MPGRGRASGMHSPTVHVDHALVGRSVHTERLRAAVERAAHFDANVLITGPSGTGKELVARQLHQLSSRCDALFIPVDCAVLSGELMATQLFGHVAGAFTGASHAALGCFRAADRGTLFLDELGEMPLCLQAKLLRVLQERSVVPVGSHSPTPVDVRIVAATNRDLKSEVAAGRFREDLFFRLNVVNIRTVPLVERRDDIAVLARHFLDELAEEGHPPKCLSPGAIEALEEFDWPGNVRQLRNVLEQAAIECDSPMIGLPAVARLLEEARLTCPDAEGSPPTPPPAAGTAVARVDAAHQWTTLEDHERVHLIATLEHTYYNRSVAARLLGISRQSLLRRMEKHGIVVPDLPGKPSK